MKLSTTQRRSVESQLGVDALLEEHPVTPDLKAAFGDHTFFLDAAGLHIIEAHPSLEGSGGSVVKVASWASDEHTELLKHAPEVLQVAVDLGSEEPEPPS